MERVRLNGPAKEGLGLYFPKPKTIQFIPTGCTLLDCVLGGGWALGRVANVIGDKAVGKTLLAIEACANFAQKYPKGKIWYREAEAAFDEAYAEDLGLPLKRVDFGSEGIGTIWDTIEDIFEDLDACLAVCEKQKVPGLYIIDSLDALTSRAELERDPSKGTFGLEKQKMLGKLFRQLIRRLKQTNVALMVISQVRDNIGVTFGEKHKRSGGKALDFYATHALWLSHMETIKRTEGGVKRAVGVRIKARCKKNKIGLTSRECEFSLIFGYGVADIEASLDFLTEVKALDRLSLKEAGIDAYLEQIEGLSGAERHAKEALVTAATVAAWADVEKRFAPRRRKYG